MGCVVYVSESQGERVSYLVHADDDGLAVGVRALQLGDGRDGRLLCVWLRESDGVGVGG